MKENFWAGFLNFVESQRLCFAAFGNLAPYESLDWIRLPFARAILPRSRRLVAMLARLPVSHRFLWVAIALLYSNHSRFVFVCKILLDESEEKFLGREGFEPSKT